MSTETREAPTASQRANPFTQGGSDYAAHRPDYPETLVDVLTDLARRRRFAVDIGCGSGQLTARLATRFNRVLGCDLSESQLGAASPHPRIAYAASRAEATPCPTGAADLITVAQAAHWLDLDAFYAEARRIAAPGAALALITYGAMRLSMGPLADRFDHFYGEEMRPYWPPERALVDAGYSTLHFPFDALTAPRLSIERRWTLAATLGYIETWSAAKAARRSGAAGDAIVDAFREEARRLWGPPDRVRQVSWPLAMRLGRL
ncbi:MAG: class I SAM-dependent methyltransferase [Pseudomonadota bacterium]